MLGPKGIVVLAAVVALAGCGGDDRRGGGGGGGGGSVSLEQLPTQLADAACTKMFECCSESEIMMQFEGFDPAPTTVEECESLFLGFLSLGTSQWEASIAEGRLAYHADRAGECLSLLRSLSCEEYNAGFSETPVEAMSCETFFEPLVEEGGTCSQDTECTTDFCEKETGADEGVCAVLPGMGEECTFDCAEGLHCEFGTGGSTCQPQKANGAECDSDGECQSDHCEGADIGTGTPGTCAIQMGCGG